MKSLQERVFSKITFSADCWLWHGGLYSNGYGRFAHSRTKKELAHRLVYRLLRGAIPPGMFLCHHCDVPNCVNPAHLFLGTQKDNMADAAQKGRCRGSVHPKDFPTNRKVTFETVQQIRRHYSSGNISQASLGKIYGLSQTGIGKIVRLKSWSPDKPYSR